MALTVSSRPKGIRSIHNGDVFYSFHESALGGKVNYKLHVLLTDDAGVILTNEFLYSMNVNGDAIVEVSEMSRDQIGFDSLGIYGVTLRSGNPNAGRRQYQKLSVSYWATWDGGFYAATNDFSQGTFVAYHGILGPLNNYYNRFDNFDAGLTITNGNFAEQLLSTKDKLKAFLNYRIAIDFAFQRTAQVMRTYIDPGTDTNRYGLPSAYISKKITPTGYGIDTLDFTPKLLSDNGKSFFKFNETEWMNLDGTFINDSSIVFGEERFGQVFRMNGSGFSEIIFNFIGVEVIGAPTKPYKIRIWNAADNGSGLYVPTTGIDTFTLNIDAHTSGADLAIRTPNYFTDLGFYAITIEPDANYEGVYDINNRLNFKFQNTAPGSGFGFLVYYNGSIWQGYNEYMDMIFTGNNESDEKVVTIKSVDSCANPVYLTWINDRGGRSYYLFDYSQDVVFNFNTFRNMMLTIYAVDVDYETWLMIQELNKVGTRINSTDKIGSVVLDLNKPLIKDYAAADDNRFQKVYVNPSQQRIRTKSTSFYGQVVIEYIEQPQNYTT